MTSPVFCQGDNRSPVEAQGSRSMSRATYRYLADQDNVADAKLDLGVATKRSK